MSTRRSVDEQPACNQRGYESDDCADFKCAVVKYGKQFKPGKLVLVLANNMRWFNCKTKTFPWDRLSRFRKPNEDGMFREPNRDRRITKLEVRIASGDIKNTYS
ncbi:hypothetical protein YC2023_120290 [Brassica napus]